MHSSLRLGAVAAVIIASTGLAHAQTASRPAGTHANGAGSHGTALGGMAAASAAAPRAASVAVNKRGAASSSAPAKIRSVDPMGGVNNRTGSVDGNATAGGAQSRQLVGDEMAGRKGAASGAAAVDRAKARP